MEQSKKSQIEYIMDQLETAPVDLLIKVDEMTDHLTDLKTKKAEKQHTKSNKIFKGDAL